MRDFPVFTTENGVGSLVFKEIPYSGIAYVTIHDSSFPTEFLAECAEFCRAAGAERVYASGHSILQTYPLHTCVLQMSASWEVIPDTDASVFPVTDQTLRRWREIYNEKMKNVDNASYMTERDAAQMLKRGDGYFVHADGELLGIGMASDDRIACVASVKPGSGRKVVCALKHALMCDRIVLDVASTNLRAIHLYESLGFIKTAETSRWYKIF
jgi:ribosomal protein S18 acetylase RimI-like enzyme